MIIDAAKRFYKKHTAVAAREWCLLFHDWNRWSEPYAQRVYGSAWRQACYQLRTCKRCGKVQRKPILE